MFDPLRQFFVAGSNVAHRLLSISVVHGFGSSQDLLRVCPESSGRIAEFSEHEAD